METTTTYGQNSNLQLDSQGRLFLNTLRKRFTGKFGEIADRSYTRVRLTLATNGAVLPYSRKGLKRRFPSLRKASRMEWRAMIDTIAAVNHCTPPDPSFFRTPVL